MVGDCGLTGYAYAYALNDPVPWEPGAGNGEPRTTVVYESDGNTQVDTYTTSTAAGPPRRQST